MAVDNLKYRYWLYFSSISADNWLITLFNKSVPSTSVAIDAISFINSL